MAEPKEPKHEIREITITPSENGGHTVEHRFKPVRQKRTNNIDSYIEPENYTFGGSPAEHTKMIDHVASHLGLKPGADQ